MKKVLKMIGLGLLLCITQNIFGQDVSDSSIYKVRTRDGNEYIGRIISQDSLELVIKTENLGTISLKKTNIIDYHKLEPSNIHAGEYWESNPQSARYFWSPNGYGLKKGEGYYQNVWVLFNQAAVGITDNISIGAGIMPLFLIAGAPTPVWITPKVSIPIVKDKWNVGAGALAAFMLGGDESENSFNSFGILYGSSTWGSRDRNLTLGLGWSYSSGEIAKTPTVNLSFMHRFSNRWYIMTENYYIDAGDDPLGIASFGARYLTKNVGLDFGLFGFFGKGLETFFGIPWIGLTVPFGKRKF